MGMMTLSALLFTLAVVGLLAAWFGLFEVWQDRALVLAFLLLAFAAFFFVRDYVANWRSQGPAQREWRDPGSLFPTHIIPLPGFGFHHEPYRRSVSHAHFVGRDELGARFLAILRHSHNFSGSYLVSGYRGVGKTSFVQKVLEEYRNGSPSIGFRRRRGPIGALVLKVLQWCYRGVGYLQVQAHRLLRNRQQGWTECRPESAALRFLARLVKGDGLLRGYWPFLLLSALAVCVDPSDDEGATSWWTLGALVLFALVLLVRRFGAAGINPAQWWRWLWRPVLTVQINLGHERLDTKRVLFDIATLLRLRYREGMGLFGMPIWLKAVLLLGSGFWLAGVLQKSLEHESVFTERNLQSLIFDHYKLNGNDIEALRGKIRDRPNAAEADRIEVALRRLQDKDFVGRDRFIQALRQVLGEYERPADGKTDEDGKSDDRKSLADLYAKTILDHAYKPLTQEPDETDKLCCRMNPEACPCKDDGPLECEDERKRGRVYATPTVVQRAYCSINFGLEHLYRWTTKPSGNAVVNPTSTSACRTFASVVNALPEKPVERLRQIIRDLGGLSTAEPDESWPSKQNLRPYHLLLYLGALAIVWSIWRLLLLIGQGPVLRRLDYINQRIISTDKVEMALPAMFGILRRERDYQPLDSRQAESLLLVALEANHRVLPFLPRADIVFVFDELDKINPAQGVDGAAAGELAPGEAVRRRKHEVEQLLSSLKNLITVAPCRFVFIAGRDMLDAELADQGQVNHLYSSLFEETFYVPSFLTDESDEQGDDITSMVEQYVCRRLLTRPIATYLHAQSEKCSVADLDDPYAMWQLRTYRKYLEETGYDDGVHKGDADLLVAFLQDLIFYLTYRSAGSPKKLAINFEQFVRPLPPQLLVRDREEYSPLVPISPFHDFVLSFCEHDQYQVQLISHIFIMLHGETGHLIRLYGDKLSLATFSILDYLLKFHAVAFGGADLERMPDVLDIHRAPALPEIIEVLLGKTLTPYLRRVDNGLYQYRFIQPFQAELDYLSQFSEADLAAFNFTLDESVLIKQHYRDLLKQQIAQTAAIPSGEQDQDHSESLPFLFEILGDLNALDQQYGDALLEYRNALQYLPPGLERLYPRQGGAPLTGAPDGPDLSDDRTFLIAASPIHLILYVRLLLKMGLIAEQRRQYADAAARYFQAEQAVDKALQGRLGKCFVPASLGQLTLLVQPGIALAFLQAKQNPLPGMADRIMKRLTEKTAEITRPMEVAPENEQIPHEVPGPGDLRRTEVQIATRWADLLAMRSRFGAAAAKYREAIKGLALVKGTCSGGRPEAGIPLMEDLGFNLSGLADACCAIAFHGLTEGTCIEGSEFRSAPDWPNDDLWTKTAGAGCTEIDIIMRRIWDVLEGPHHLANLADRLGHYPEIIAPATHEWMAREGLGLYVLSAACYRLAHQPADAALSLVKAVSFLVPALAARRLAPRRRTERPDWAFQGAPKCWLLVWPGEAPARGSSPVEVLLREAFEWSYDAHRKRLEKRLKITSVALKDWIAPPLAQIDQVLRAFLEASAKAQSRADPLRTAWWADRPTAPLPALRDMGAFPLHARILAGFLKGWRYVELAGALDGKSARCDTTKNLEDRRRWLLRGFLLLVRAAEDAAAYAGGGHLLSPPPGFIYYLLYRAHKCGIEPKVSGNDKVSAQFVRINRFDGERRRFQDQEHCRVRALDLLRTMVARHRGEQGFVEATAGRYYLHDDFSDPYQNGLWALDYALEPVARAMILELATDAESQQ